MRQILMTVQRAFLILIKILLNVRIWIVIVCRLSIQFYSLPKEIQAHRLCVCPIRIIQETGAKASDDNYYAFGLFALLAALDDGGHTGFSDISWITQEVLGNWLETLGELGIGRTEKTEYINELK